ncbi:beta-1,4-galactosyltransferase 4 isoform X2 [Lingula anatina]|uniref:Beta-1,4-galactosyltransferase n=1 Tax=Lingula anatina TaxID=7574 RepID=A0A1S3JQA2_LINAN|nr:beta-1,4-galactosyltransferase 4 isoform X2 [Lingula anatina]|eukprot:XP_013412139.1 beta-1,4-galactosyltransferase 4 isoform X2 [Lingula anatina]
MKLLSFFFAFSIVNLVWIVAVNRKIFRMAAKSLDICIVTEENLENAFQVNLGLLPIPNRTELFKEVATGGRWAPTSCKPRDHVAIIIPYRDRQEHLDVLLQNLHPFLQSQKCHYQIFVIEQAHPEPFNTGYAKNIGFVEASAMFDFTCYIFQDVDKIPMNNSLLYRCPPDRVFHFASAEDRYNYSLLYPNYIGGAIGFTPDTFKKINGFANNFIRWGGDDDDLFHRIVAQKVPIEHAHTHMGMYRVLNHTHPPGYDNKENFKMSQFASKLYKQYGTMIDGLNTLNYTRLATEYRPTYTWIKFNVDQNSMMKTVWKGIMDTKYDKEVNNTYWAINYERAHEMFPKVKKEIKRKTRDPALTFLRKIQQQRKVRTKSPNSQRH